MVTKNNNYIMAMLQILFYERLRKLEIEGRYFTHHHHHDYH